ncbi:MAG TPA: hypothetical protein ENN99_10380 [Chloroflexi bacterium]|nr:hypothetical protein [Chloroflexota bacterium]
MYELERRIKRAAESILENESLTAALDDDTAQELVAWGLDCTKTVVQNTANMNAAEAEERIRPQLRAIGRLMRSIGNWMAARQKTAETGAPWLEDILEQAAVIYGRDVSFPSIEQREAFLHHVQSIAHGAQAVLAWRQFIEGTRDLPASLERDDPPDPETPY